MAIPKINEEDITAAIKYIEENGVPEKNKSSRSAGFHISWRTFCKH